MELSYATGFLQDLFVIPSKIFTTIFRDITKKVPSLKISDNYIGITVCNQKVYEDL